MTHYFIKTVLKPVFYVGFDYFDGIDYLSVDLNSFLSSKFKGIVGFMH